MPRDPKTIFRLLGAAIFIALEVAALGMLKDSATLQNIWINRASHLVMGKLWSSGETVRNHFSLEKQNAALYEENFRLQEQLRAYKIAEEAEQEAEATVTPSLRFTYIPATVTKISRNSSHNYIILNKGSEDGVKPYSGIITSKGVVGIISAVDRHYSYGLTLMNTNVSVSSRVGHSGTVGPLIWDGRHSNKALLKDLPLHYDMALGDTVRTSGFSSIFPPDIPIGVTGETTVADGSTNVTEVTLFEDFSTLRYVTIVENPERAEISALENDVNQ